MISSKGFLFTISIVLFATTLVFYGQTYSSTINNRELLIIENYKLSFVPFIVDDISTDLLSLMGINFDKQFVGSDVIVNISGELPKENINSALSEYEYFLDNNYFKKSIGEKTIDLSDISSNGFIINFSTNSFIYDYEKSIIFLTDEFDSIDLNMFVLGKDINKLEVDFNDDAPTIPLKINYFDDTNIITINEEINISNLSTIKFIYNDANILINVGLNNSNYFNLDSNLDSQVNYSLALRNEFTDEVFESNSNVLFNYKAENIDVNSFIKIN